MKWKCFKRENSDKLRGP